MANNSYGFLVQCFNQGEGGDLDFTFTYVSLNEAQLSDSLISSWPETEDEAAEALVHHRPYHPIPLNFSHLVAHSSDNKRICASHNGLILISLRIDSTYHVLNPYNNGQSYILPPSPSLAEIPRPYSLEDATIVNFSTTERDFKVIRIVRYKGRRAEVYSSNTGAWHKYDLHHNRAIFPRSWRFKWNLTGAVFVDNTLYFLAGSKHIIVVGVEIPHEDEPIAVVRSLELPRSIPAGQLGVTLHGSQGCLYLSYARRDYLGIWRRHRSRRNREAWISEFIFDNDEGSPRRPRIEEYLRGIYRDEVDPMSMHPEEPIIYLYRRPDIVAFHLVNDVLNNQPQQIQLQHHPYIITQHFDSFAPCSVMLEDQA